MKVQLNNPYAPDIVAFKFFGSLLEVRVKVNMNHVTYAFDKLFSELRQV